MAKFNSKLLMIAAFLLLLLALLVLATPLLRTATGSRMNDSNFRQPLNPQGMPGIGGFPGSSFPEPSTSDFPASNFPGNPSRTSQAEGPSFIFGFLRGMTGTLIYAGALVISVIAAMGMFLLNRWGQVLGIIMAILYAILAVVNILPTVLIGFILPLELGLNIAALILAVAVIVLAALSVRRTAAA